MRSEPEDMVLVFDVITPNKLPRVSRSIYLWRNFISGSMSLGRD